MSVPPPPSGGSFAQATAPAPSAEAKRVQADRVDHPLEHLTLEETLRVMDVAREMREARESAEEMFRRDDLRAKLRDKLMRQARLSGDTVTEAEIDSAITQYLETLHVYEDPPAGLKSMLAHGWVYRGRLLLASIAGMVAAGGFWYFFT